MGTFRAETSYRDWVFRIAKHLWLNRMRAGATIKRRAHEISYEDAFVDGRRRPPASRPSAFASSPGRGDRGGKGKRRELRPADNR